MFGHQINFSKSIRYLGVQIDERRTFTEHVETLANRAAEMVMTIGRLMTNISGPSQAKRRLLMTVVYTKLF